MTTGLAAPLGDQVRLAVVAAHRTGHPLHHQLAALGARPAGTSLTFPVYRLLALPGVGVARGGIVWVGPGGGAVEVELHDLSPARLGSLLETLPPPLAVGHVALADGTWSWGWCARTYPPAPSTSPSTGAGRGTWRARGRAASTDVGSVDVETRVLGRTGKQVGVVGLGCWQIGAGWGQVDEDDALAVLHAAVDEGVTFLDTADVYGDGRSESLIGRFLKERGSQGLVVATKAGRRADPHVPEAYSAANLRAWVDRSRSNLGLDTLDLVQLHCPPTPVYSMDAVFDALDGLVERGAVAAYGVSVETADEALTAIARPNLATVQIILNAFRRKPLEQVLPAAREAGVGIIARVPLASGLLSGKYDETTTFAADDHRSYNRHGEAFDVGETFSGVPYEVGVRAARDLAALVPGGTKTAAFALRWILDQDGVSVVIPGARNPDQARGNAAAADLPPLTPAQLSAVERIYDERIREHVHDRW